LGAKYKWATLPSRRPGSRKPNQGYFFGGRSTLSIATKAPFAVARGEVNTAAPPTVVLVLVNTMSNNEPSSVGAGPDAAGSGVMTAGTTWYFSTRANCTLSAARAASVSFGTAAKASSVGTAIVNGPPVFSASANPASVTSFTNVGYFPSSAMVVNTSEVDGGTGIDVSAVEGFESLGVDSLGVVSLGVDGVASACVNGWVIASCVAAAEVAGAGVDEAQAARLRAATAMTLNRATAVRVCISFGVMFNIVISVGQKRLTAIGRKTYFAILIDTSIKRPM
jgi:hypothetical protein